MEALPLILDPTAKEIGFVRMPSGNRCLLLCKAGRYYYRSGYGSRTIRIGRDEAAQRYEPFESDTVN